MKKILVVDDHEEIRELLSKFLLSNGYEVDTAEDGETALKKVTEKEYDLIITDYIMPKINGVNLLRRLKIESPRLAILIISGSMVGDGFFAQSGADAFLPKPLDLPRMKILIEEILNSRK